MHKVQPNIVFRPSENKKALDQIVEELVKTAIRKALAKYPGTSCTDDFVIKRNPEE